MQTNSNDRFNDKDIHNEHKVQVVHPSKYIMPKKDRREVTRERYDEVPRKGVVHLHVHNSDDDEGDREKGKSEMSGDRIIVNTKQKRVDEKENDRQTKKKRSGKKLERCDNKGGRQRYSSEEYVSLVKKENTMLCNMIYAQNNIIRCITTDVDKCKDKSDVLAEAVLKLMDGRTIKDMGLSKKLRKDKVGNSLDGKKGKSEQKKGLMEKMVTKDFENGERLVETSSKLEQRQIATKKTKPAGKLFSLRGNKKPLKGLKGEIIEERKEETSLKKDPETKKRNDMKSKNEEPTYFVNLRPPKDSSNSGVKINRSISRKNKVRFATGSVLKAELDDRNSKKALHKNVVRNSSLEYSPHHLKCCMSYIKEKRPSFTRKEELNKVQSNHSIIRLKATETSRQRSPVKRNILSIRDLKKDLINAISDVFTHNVKPNTLLI